MATMASSTILPMVGCLALAWRWDQRASLGTQKTFSAGIRPDPRGRAGVFALAGNELGAVFFEGVGDVLEEDEPRTTCLYSAASMLLRSLSAASQSLASNPRLAPVVPGVGESDFRRAMFEA